ncbi:50S ribosomal protein L29 [Pontibacter silvestris]|uniref:Large ribosomal subunit protein uL29 n=1 Tax=Pontibacter silvestris TaxID=2305183 RepID=A0ABW4WXX2_9BACT|nr:50S ribosomal protein L29 [Pontibacter silvestris]MCC9137652.1 50S ribosomal protein L29 [Pontibacter silvestris]
MKNSEIKALSLEELKERLSSEQSGMQSLQFAHAISPLENPMKIRQTRKTIARLNTEIRRREIEANS